MILVSLQSVANQSLSIRLDGNQYDIRIVDCGDCMAATVVKNNVTLIENVRLVAGTPVLPYPWMYDGGFVILTENDDLPDWRKFGITQFMYYVSPDEVDA
jgi:hypothetical protein